MAVPSDTQITEYIKLLKETKYIEEGIERTQAENMIDILTFMDEVLDVRKDQAQVMLAFYTTRLTRVEYVLEQIEENSVDENLDEQYQEFKEYSMDYSLMSSYMDSIAGMINYTFSDYLEKLRKYTREQKLVSGAVLRFQNFVETYDILKTDIAELIGRLS